MTVLLVLGGSGVLLGLWCWWEARSGRPAWGAHLGSEAPRAGDGARAGKRGVAGAVTSAAVGLDGGGDG